MLLAKSNLNKYKNEIEMNKYSEQTGNLKKETNLKINKVKDTIKEDSTILEKRR